MSDHEPVSVSQVRDIIGLIDLTNLNDDCDVAAIAALCTQALTPAGSVAAVCVWPEFVAAARERLGSDSKVAIATVVNFPAGNSSIDSSYKVIDTALDEGANELDYVMPYTLFADGQHDAVATELGLLRKRVPAEATLKIILETGQLATPELIRSAAILAIEQGADFIKTSTGKVSVNATPAAASVMLEAIKQSDRCVGFKAAGGIRTVAEANQYLTLARGCLGESAVDSKRLRFGASSLLQDALKHLNPDQADGDGPVDEAGY